MRAHPFAAARATWIIRGLAFAAPMCASTLAPAQAPESAPASAPVRGELQELVKALDSSDFKARDEATQRLATDPAFTLAEIESVLRAGHLSSEQRSRLLMAARERFERSPRAAMGVQFGGNLRDRIVVGQTFEKFSSRALLEEGDMIIEAAGVRLSGPTAQRTIQGLIVSRDPGDVLPMVVRRGASKVNIELSLGNFADLPNSTLGDGRLIRAWRVRSGSYAPAYSDADIITTGLPAAAWPSQDVVRNHERIQRMRQKLGQAPIAGLAGGGVPGGPQADPEEMRFQQIIVNGNVIGNARLQAVDPDMEVTFPGMTLQEELNTLSAQRNGILQNLDQMTRNAGPEIRAGMEQRLRIVEKQRQAIEAEIAESGAPTSGVSSPESPGRR